MGKPPDVDSVCGKLSDQWILVFLPFLAHDGVRNLGHVHSSLLLLLDWLLTTNAFEFAYWNFCYFCVMQLVGSSEVILANY